MARAPIVCLALFMLAGCTPADDSAGPASGEPSSTMPPTPTDPPGSSPPPSTPAGIALSGEAMQWHPITLTLDGPSAEETGSPNPFTDYRLRATFQKDAQSFTVPGFFAACEDAANTGCTSGDKWRVIFTPNETGVWSYVISFTQGADVALGGDGDPVAGLDGASGTVTIAASDKIGRDFRAPGNGRLRYTGQHYLQFSDGRPFFKAGADAPENALAYEDFDATPNKGGRRKSWAPHRGDYAPNEAAQYTWGGGDGQDLLGALKYLADENANAFSFLTFSLQGDDKNVFPHLLRNDEADFTALSDNRGWQDGVYRDRFDVSKMAQWDRVFSYADQLGLFLHFKTMETENDELMDGGAFGRERQIYYRELIARFGHHLALNWNIGEEYTLSTDVARTTLDYIAQTDPYGHLRVMHTFPGQQDQRYGPLTGNQSAMTGASIQTSNNNFTEVRSRLVEWVTRSRNDGAPWVVALDEPGSASRGVSVDASYPDGLLPEARNETDNRRRVRGRVLWNALTAGSGGVEYYYGYQTGCDDLDCQDHRTRAEKWSDAAHAISFFDNHISTAALSMSAADVLLTTGNGATSATSGVYVLPSSSPQTIAIEAEDIGPTPPDDWVFENDKPGFTGTGYYRWAGPDLFNINKAGQGVLSYVVEIPQSEGGDYRYVFRARRISRTDGRTDLNNDIWMRVISIATGDQIQPNGQSGQNWWKMFFSGSLTEWTWSSNLDRQDGVKIPATYELTPGQYRIEISGRSTEFHLDRMTLNKGTNRSTTTSITTAPTSSGANAGAAAGVADADNYLFASLGEIYVAYLANDADSQVLDLRDHAGSFAVRWFNPRSGGGLSSGSVGSVAGGDFRALGAPPADPDEDWVVLITHSD
ncbi:MAG: DUF5060 domain-containing protein [Pseudomonadota bacterium]